MGCPASGKLFPINSLTVLKGEEDLVGRVVSGGNKLSLTKFVCPEPGCGKSVDVYYRGEECKIRHHAARGERVSMVGGERGVSVRNVSLSSMAELVTKQQEAFAAEMAKLIKRAEDDLVTFDTRIETQVGLIKQAEARIEELKAEKAKAEELLTNPEFERFRKVAGE